MLNILSGNYITLPYGAFNEKSANQLKSLCFLVTSMVLWQTLLYCLKYSYSSALIFLFICVFAYSIIIVIPMVLKNTTTEMQMIVTMNKNKQSTITPWILKYSIFLTYTCGFLVRYTIVTENQQTTNPKIPPIRKSYFCYSFHLLLTFHLSKHPLNPASIILLSMHQNRVLCFSWHQTDFSWIVIYKNSAIFLIITFGYNYGPLVQSHYLTQYWLFIISDLISKEFITHWYR